MSTSFGLVKDVLDDLYKRIESAHNDQADQAIKNALASLSGQYRDLDKDTRVPVDYSDPAIRFGYVFRYVAAHSSYVRDICLRSLPISQLLSSDARVKVTCLGGGPGTELIGLIQASNRLDRKKDLLFSLIDREDAWADTWENIDEELDAGFRVSTNFRAIDISRPFRLENLNGPFGSDIFVMSYFLSEIYAFRDACSSFFDSLVRVMNPGAIVVNIDNGNQLFNSYADSIFTDSQFNLLKSENNTRLLPSADEQKSSLGEYLDRFGYPKVEARAGFRIWSKR
jgi:hypothetical protein